MLPWSPPGDQGRVGAIRRTSRSILGQGRASSNTSNTPALKGLPGSKRRRKVNTGLPVLCVSWAVLSSIVN